MIVSLLVGRKGSVGFPGKNTYPVLGRPMAEYQILAVKNCKSIDKAYFSTDDPELMTLAQKHNIEVIERPPELCTKEALGEDAFKHGYEEIARRNPEHIIEMITLHFCNAPTILPSTIEAGITALQNDHALDSAISVSKYNMWSPVRARKVNSKGQLSPFIPFEVYEENMKIDCDRDSQGDVYFHDCGVSIVRPYCLKKLDDGLLPQKWMGRNIYPLIQWGGLDIDFEWQLPQAKYWLRANGFTEDVTPYD